MCGPAQSEQGARSWGLCRRNRGWLHFSLWTHVGAALGWSSVELSQPAFLLQLQSPSTRTVDTSTLEMNKLDVGLSKPRRQRSGFCEAICRLGRALQETPDKSAPFWRLCGSALRLPRQQTHARLLEIYVVTPLPACEQARA